MFARGHELKQRLVPMKIDQQLLKDMKFHKASIFLGQQIIMSFPELLALFSDELPLNHGNEEE